MNDHLSARDEQFVGQLKQTVVWLKTQRTMIDESLVLLDKLIAMYITPDNPDPPTEQQKGTQDEHRQAL